MFALPSALHVPLPLSLNPVMGLTRMQALIGSWHVRCGFSFDRPRLAAEFLPHEKTAQTDRHHNEDQGRPGGTGALMQNIIPFDAVWPVLSR